MAFSGALVASLFGSATVSAAVPTVLLYTTVKAATSHAVGSVATTVVSAKVAALTKGGSKGMITSKLAGVTGLLLLMGALTSGAWLLIGRGLAVEPQESKADKKADQKGQPKASTEGSQKADSGKATWRDTLTMKHDHPITAVACSPDWSVAGDEGGTLFAWDTKTRKNRTRLGKTGSTVDRLQFTADGKYLYTFGKGGRSISRWIPPWKDKFNGAGFRSDELSWIGASPDGDTWLMPEKRGRLLGLRPGAFSNPDGEGRFRIPPGAFDYETVKYEAKVSHALLSANDKWLAVVTEDGTLHVHDRASLQETHTIAAGKKGVVITAMQFSPDGKRVAVARDDAQAKVYDTATGEEVATLKGHSGIVFAVAFSPDGKKLVTGGHDNVARIWDAATGKVVATLKGHSDSVRCVAFDPSGEILVTGSADKTVKLWRTR
jgi:WD40 repeat protein